MATRKAPRPERARLRRERMRRGWSANDVAVKLYNLGTQHGVSEDQLGVDARAVSRWELGKTQPNQTYTALLSLLYNLPPGQLDLPPLVIPVVSTSNDPPEDSHAPTIVQSVPQTDEPLKRREFTKGIVGLVGALSLAEWERLVRLSGDGHNRDDLDPFGDGSARLRPGRINLDEVTELERMVRTFERWDAQSGGARWRKAIVGHLRSVVDLLEDDLRCEESVQQRLLVVCAQLAQLSGWTAYDSRLYRSAHRYYTLGIHAAKRAQRHSLAAKIFGDMAILANAVGRHDDELRLVSEALASFPTQAPITVQPELLGLQARAYANLGRERDSQRTIATCMTVFFEVEYADERPHYLDQAEVNCMAANAYIELALHSTSPLLSAFASHAEQHVLNALADRNPAYVRSRVLDTIRLAYVRLVQRDPVEAATVATQALDLVGDVSSPRVLERIVEFNKNLRHRFPTVPEAHQFEERLRQHLGQFPA